MTTLLVVLLVCLLTAYGEVCNFDGLPYNPGESYNSTDGCTTCTCLERGAVRCTRLPCRVKMICPVVSPPGSSFGVCAEMCRSDDDCAFDEKCCSNRCGHQCVKGTPCAAVLYMCPRVNCSSEDLIPAGPDKCCNSCRCRYGGKVYNPGDTFPASDGCNNCTCQGNGRVSCTEVACLQSCTHSFCQSEPKATCSIPCNGGPKVTSCQACYYDDEERSVPKKCRYRCGENPKKKCLCKWAKCVAKKYKRKFGTTPIRLRTASLFKCAVPVPCEDE